VRVGRIDPEGVIRRMFVPSASMISIAPFSFGLAALLVRTNAIFVPSGDHCGWRSSVLVAGLF
jgi:hypothetical protein